MQKPNKRKLIKILLLTLFVLTIFNGARVYFSAEQSVNVKFDAINDVASSLNRAQGNYVLYTEDNGIKTFPFIWGGRLFLYDVAKNRSYPIKLSVGYNGEFKNDLSMRGNLVYYSRSGFKGDGGPTEMLNLENTEHVVPSGISSQENYLVTDKYLYGINDSLGIYKGPFESREKELLFKGEGYYYIDCLGESLYAFNEEGNYIIEKALRGDSVKRYTIPKSHLAIKILKNEPDYFIYINKAAGTIVRYSKRDGTTKTIVKFQEGVPYGEYYTCDTFKCEGDYLYINDVAFSVLRVNLKDGSITKLIDQSKKLYDIESASISYCTDYIVIDTIKTALFRSKTLSVYDYSGKLIREKHLKVRL